MMLSRGMKVWLPANKSGDRPIGMIIEISKRSNQQQGLTTGRNQVKVRYEAGFGCITEKWIDIDKVERVKSLKEISEEEKLQAEQEKEAELEKVAKLPKEKTQWHQKIKAELGNDPNTGSGKVIKGLNSAESHDQSQFLG